MSRLVEQLKKEHTAILGVLEQVKQLGVNTKEGREKLLSARASFMAHLKKEDNELYPVLKKAAADDPRLQRTLETFAKDMDVVSKDIQKFFDKHMRESAANDLVGDFSTLFATVKSRMRKEENVLYADYDRLQ